jgi:lysophospholipase L1-like esterase
VFAAGEVWLRLADGQSAPERSKRYPQGTLCKREPSLGWIGEPNKSRTMMFSSEDMEEMHVKMNSEGFWDEEHEARKPPGVKRILFLGDSFTVGYGVPREKKFTETMKASLPKGFEVINLGMWGYSVDQELLVLESMGLKYAPDVVVVCLFLDDLFCTNLVSINDGIYIKPKFSLTWEGGLVLENVPVPNNRGRSFLLNLILTRFCDLQNRIEVGWEFDRRGWLSVFDRAFVKRLQFSLALRLIYEMFFLSEENDARFLLVVIPFKDQLNDTRAYESVGGYGGIPTERLDLRLPQKVINRFCEKAGIPVLDLLNAFEKHDLPEELFFRSDLHWTAEGHRLAADEILSYLRELKYVY